MTSLMTLNQHKNKKKYAMIASFKGKLKNRIPGLRLLVYSLPGSALRTHVVESLGKPYDVNEHSLSLAWST